MSKTIRTIPSLSLSLDISSLRPISMATTILPSDIQTALLSPRSALEAKSSSKDNQFGTAIGSAYNAENMGNSEISETAKTLKNSKTSDFVSYSVEELHSHREVNVDAPSDFPSPSEFPCIIRSASLQNSEKEKNSKSGKSGKSQKPQKPENALSHTENRWERKQVVGMDKLVRKLNLILNKLTLNLFDTLSAQFVQLVRENCDSFEMLKEIVALVHEKALKDVHLGDMFPRFCEFLATQLPSYERRESGERVSFRKAMLERSQEQFQVALQIADFLNENETETEENFEKSEIVAKSGKSGKSEKEEEEEEFRLKQKLRMLGTMKFLGELYKRGMVTTKIVSHCIALFLASPSQSYLECLCVLLTTAGAKLEADPELRFASKARNRTTPMRQWMAALERIAGSSEVSTRIRFNVLEVVELRRNSWVPRREQEEAAGVLYSSSSNIGNGNSSVIGIGSSSSNSRFIETSVTKGTSGHSDSNGNGNSTIGMGIGIGMRLGGDRYGKKRLDRVAYANEMEAMKLKLKQRNGNGNGNELDSELVNELEKDNETSDGYGCNIDWEYSLPEDVGRQIRGFVTEYTQARDLEEARLCMQEVVGVDSRVRDMYVVVECLLGALDKSNKEREMVVELLDRLLEKEVLGKEDLVKGLALAMFNLVEGMCLLSDLPVAPARMNGMLFNLQVPTEALTEAQALVEDALGSHECFDTICMM